MIWWQGISLHMYVHLCKYIIGEIPNVVHYLLLTEGSTRPFSQLEKSSPHPHTLSLIILSSTPLSLKVSFSFWVQFLLCLTGELTHLHATCYVSKWGLQSQQGRRPPLSADPWLQVHQVPGAANSGACEFLFCLTVLTDGKFFPSLSL